MVRIERWISADEFIAKAEATAQKAQGSVDPFDAMAAGLDPRKPKDAQLIAKLSPEEVNAAARRNPRGNSQPVSKAVMRTYKINRQD